MGKNLGGWVFKKNEQVGVDLGATTPSLGKEFAWRGGALPSLAAHRWTRRQSSWLLSAYRSPLQRLLARCILPQIWPMGWLG
jgi:hypothetical protein